MKKFILPVLAVISVIQFYSCTSKKSEGNGTNNEASADDSGHKYKMRSAIVTTDIKSGMMPGTITSKLYFDDYGEKEKTETNTNVSMMGKTIDTKTCSLIKDGYAYTWQSSTNTGTKMKLDKIQDPTKLDYRNLSEDMMKQLGISKAGSENVFGKDCDKYVMTSESMGSGTYWIWENIVMKADINMGGMNMTMEVTDIDSNPKIDDSEFELPKDITFTEMTMPQMQ